MSKAVMFISFKLVEGASVADFKLAAAKVHSEFLSKQPGYTSWQQLVEGELWADLITWETMADAQNAMVSGAENAANQEFFAFLDEASIKAHIFTVEKNY